MIRFFFISNKIISNFKFNTSFLRIPNIYIYFFFSVKKHNLEENQLIFCFIIQTLDAALSLVSLRRLLPLLQTFATFTTRFLLNFIPFKRLFFRFCSCPFKWINLISGLTFRYCLRLCEISKMAGIRGELSKAN